ncbi:ACT domain-containing protein ACR8-like protein [Tanacetum coccineum]|uniref:ACT domain-containing protein ACR n=1 Tax=Tanacetum coccineum TaxID=301880 RepID=A0ABQ5A5U8_9ASTR
MKKPSIYVNIPTSCDQMTDISSNLENEEDVLSLGTLRDTRYKSIDRLTVIELTGTYKVGLLSEVFAVLSELKCDVVESKVWTPNGQIASLIYLKHRDFGCSIEDSQKMPSPTPLSHRKSVYRCYSLAGNLVAAASVPLGPRLGLCPNSDPCLYLAGYLSNKTFAVTLR